MPEARSTGVLQTENGRWVATRLVGPRIAVVFDAPSRAPAESLLSKL
jgi:hypothetical protein